jgi:hypothetical protein
VFDIRQQVTNRSGEPDERKVEGYIEGLLQEFVESPEAKPLLDSDEGLGGWAEMMMDYGVSYCGVTPAKMTPADFNEVLFELFPRKVSTPPESAPAIVKELRAFWQFVQRQYGLGNAGKILAALGDSAAERLRKELADPSNYGMAKSFFMMGQEAGFDMTTQAGLDQFMLAYNSRLLGNPDLAMPPAFEPDFDPEEDDFLPLPSRPTPKERAEKRKARKRQRQARKRHRK